MLSSSENICKDIYWRIKGNKPPRLLLFLVLFHLIGNLSFSGIKDSAQVLLQEHSVLSAHC